MKITASIVTFNSADEIEKVLVSLLKHNLEMDNIYVVDNGSSDGTTEIVKKKFDGVNLIETGKNIGFGAGHNLALKSVQSDYHIFINPDIIVEEGEIEKMAAYMESHKDVVVMTPKILNLDGTEQFVPKKRPKFKYIFAGRFEYKFKWCYKLRSEYTLRDVVINEPTEIDCCSGCFMFCRTSVLLDVNGFDERYFLYFEDADLTRELQKYGKAMYVPNCSVTHAWHRDVTHSNKARKIALRSMFQYFRKWRGKK